MEDEKSTKSAAQLSFSHLSKETSNNEARYWVEAIDEAFKEPYLEV